MQSSLVIVQKAINTTVHGEWVLKYTVSFALKKALTFENTFSIGFSSGEYGGRKRTIEPTPVMMSATSS